jgi:hypothetical protein
MLTLAACGGSKASTTTPPSPAVIATYCRTLQDHGTESGTELYKKLGKVAPTSEVRNDLSAMNANNDPNADRYHHANDETMRWCGRGIPSGSNMP